jgi:hypothetical protein
MKYILQLSLFLFTIPTAAVENSALSKKTDQFASEHAEIKALCIKNANEAAGTGARRESICECSVKKSIEFLVSPEFKNKDPKPRIEWLKKMYAMKLTPQEIEADEFDILEFNIPITTECMKTAKK